MRVRMNTFFALSAFMLSAYMMPHVASAHGTGLTITSTTSNYFIDVDYSAFIIYALETGRFDFRLFKDPERTEPVDFTQVWVRLIQDNETVEGETVFSGWISRAIFGSTGMSIQLPAAGTYRMTLRYNDGDNLIIEETLPFTVDPDPTRTVVTLDRNFWIGLAGGAVLLGAAFLVYSLQASRRRR